MLKITVGIICILLGIWEFYTVRGVFVRTKKNGGKNTSSFLLAGLGSAVIFGVALIGIGITLILNGY